MYKLIPTTRMHSSGIRTVRCSGCLRRVSAEEWGKVLRTVNICNRRTFVDKLNV